MSSLKHVTIEYFIDLGHKSLPSLLFISVLSDAAESLQQFREAVFYSGTHQKMNELRSWATNYICKGKSLRHTYQQEFQAQNTLGWLPTEIFHQSVFYSTVAPTSFFVKLFSTAENRNQQIWYLPSFLTLSFSGTQLFCDTLSSHPNTVSLSQDAKGACVSCCGGRRQRRHWRWSLDP